MSRSVSSREVRLHDQDELDCTSPCESSVHSAIVCPVKCREVTVKKKRVETFRKIYGMVTVVDIYHYTDSAAAVGPPAQARPITSKHLCIAGLARLARKNAHEAVRYRSRKSVASQGVATHHDCFLSEGERFHVIG